MSVFSISQFFPNQLSNNVSQIQTLHVRPSANQSGAKLIEREGPYGQRTLLYTMITSKSSKPNIQLSRVSPDALSQTVIGEAIFHLTSCSVDLSLHGRPISMKESLSGNRSFTWPPVGKLKWAKNSMGTALELIDGTGFKMARCKDKKKIEVLIQCDDYLLDAIVLSGMAASRAQDDGAVDAVMEVVGSLVGG